MTDTAQIYTKALHTLDKISYNSSFGFCNGINFIVKTLQ